EVEIHFIRCVPVVESNRQRSEVVVLYPARSRVRKCSLQEHGGLGKAGGRDDIIRKRLPRVHAVYVGGAGRIENRRGEIAEVAGPLFPSGNGYQNRRRTSAVPEPVVRTEEKDPVSDHRSSQVESELVLMLRRTRGREEAAGVEIGVAEELV